MIDVIHFKELIIEPTLKRFDLYSEAATNLLLGTAIQESRLTYLKQLGNGPALGVYQMEPSTHDDIWENYLKFNTVLRWRIGGGDKSAHTPTRPRSHKSLVSDLAYATIMARIHYLRRPEALPEADDVEGMAQYWKDHYNTHLGKGTAAEYLDGWELHHRKRF